MGLVAPARHGTAGFTLVEALVSMLLATLIVMMVTGVFLVQNEFYADAVKRASLQENVRGAVSSVASELRGVAAGGITVAEADSVVFRIPLVVGGVCRVVSSATYLLFPLDGEGVTASEVSGYAVRAADGSWTYNTATWASIYNSSGVTPAADCAYMGADTVGATADFFRLDGLSASPALAVGGVVMIFRTMAFKLDDSALDTTTMALYRRPGGGTMTEFATGLSGNSAFSYLRAGNTSFESRVTNSGELAAIQVIRLVAQGIAPSSRAGRDSLTFDLTLRVPLRNAR